MSSKYDRLGDHLAALGAATIILTFAAVEAVIGPLPTVARRDSFWWGATPSGRYANPHALGWWRAGYVADLPDFAGETVTFRRVAGAGVVVGGGGLPPTTASPRWVPALCAVSPGNLYAGLRRHGGGGHAADVVHSGHRVP